MLVVDERPPALSVSDPYSRNATRCRVGYLSPVLDHPESIRVCLLTWHGDWQLDSTRVKLSLNNIVYKTRLLPDFVGPSTAYSAHLKRPSGVLRGPPGSPWSGRPPGCGSGVSSPRRHRPRPASGSPRAVTLRRAALRCPSRASVCPARREQFVVTTAETPAPSLAAGSTMFGFLSASPWPPVNTGRFPENDARAQVCGVRHTAPADGEVSWLCRTLRLMLRVILRDLCVTVTGKFCVCGLSEMSVLVLEATLLREAPCQGLLVSPVPTEGQGLPLWLASAFLV